MGLDPAKGTRQFEYRRLIDRTNFAPVTCAGDITLVNWLRNDYVLGNLAEVAPEEAARHLAAAKQLSILWLNRLSAGCPRPNGVPAGRGCACDPTSSAPKTASPRVFRSAPPLPTDPPEVHAKAPVSFQPVSGARAELDGEQQPMRL
ncbi:MAG: hypothetical protein FJ399_13470 [Verrucomicrobia bacterium]|nr:hypothetical protein [Verrucomicrobiota bacterium]